MRSAKQEPAMMFFESRQRDFGFSNQEILEFTAFKKEWKDLPKDPYLPPEFGSRYRKYAKFCYRGDTGQFERIEATPYFQSDAVNPVSGGMHRSFAIFEEGAADEVLKKILKKNLDALELDPWQDWVINVHLIRIVASAEVAGVPCPEGVHSDGFHAISIHLIDRFNIVGDETTIYDNSNALLGKCRLQDTLDTVYAFDEYVKHFTSDFKSLDGKQGYRDTLLTSFDSER